MSFSDLPLDVRRSLAAGEVGRAQLALDLGEGAGRGVDVSILMTEAQVAELRQTGTNVLLDQVAGWCGTATTVTIRPVLNLYDHHRINGYAPTESIREQVLLTWPQCVFPFCTRRARRCDLDHRCPHGDGGPTCPCNLAPLCRTHHRMKTFSGWTYEPADTTESGIPTAFTWTSPEGNRFRVDAAAPHPNPDHPAPHPADRRGHRHAAGCRTHGPPFVAHAAGRSPATIRPRRTTDVFAALYMSMSLDGMIAGPHVTSRPDSGTGVSASTQWLFPGCTWRRQPRRLRRVHGHGGGRRRRRHLRTRRRVGR